MASFIYGDDNVEADGVKFCSCCRFTNGADLPSPRDLTITEIKIEAPRFAARVLSNWTQLNACLKRFEAVIQKRWLKKTDKQRREILLKAWPRIPRVHRPDFLVCRTRKKQTALTSRESTTTKQSHAFLYPYINLQDLQQDHLLPVFLHSRGRTLPEAFVTADLENSHRGRGWPSAPDPDKPAMAFASGHTPRKYGRLFRQKASTTQLVVRPTYAPITGLFILEVQDGIYDFLLSCCRTILHDNDANSWFLSPSLPAPDAPTPSSKRGEWTSLPALALEAPYCAPCQLDIDRLQMLVGAKRSAAEDHIWLLREDPGYFLGALKDRMEHGTEPEWNDEPEHTWKHVAGKLMAEAFCSFYCWDELHGKLAIMEFMEVQLERADHKKGRLFSYDEGLWAYIDAIVEMLIEGPLLALTNGLPISPRMRAMSTFKRGDDDLNHWSMKTGRSDAENRVFVLFWALFNKEQRELHGPSKLVQEIQHMLETDTDACELLDAWVIERFSDVALLAEIQRGISSFQPWARGWRLHNVDQTRIVARTIENTVVRNTACTDILSEAPCAGNFTSLGIPTDGRFYYPADKKRTKETTDEMRAAEKNLRAFMSDMSAYFYKSTDRPLFSEFQYYSERQKMCHRTPPWIEPKVTVAPSTPVKALALKDMDINTWRGPESENKKREILDSGKAKVKTRGEAKTTSQPCAEQAADGHENEEDIIGKRTPFKLPKRAYRVFSTLLPSASSLAHVGKELAWDELLYAMNAVGLQPEKLYGSVWVFRPLPKEQCLVQAERSIQFHEPKEVRRGSKIPPYMVRTLGRRLKYAFGWEAGDFECE